MLPQESMNPIDRVRMRVTSTLIPELAELIYRCDKGHKLAKLSDLPEVEQSVYIAEALMITDKDERDERVKHVNSARAHGHAIRDREREHISRQARIDRSRYSQVTAKFPICVICGENVITNRVEIVAAEKVEIAHGLCAAKNEDRYEFVNEFFYQVKQ